MGYILQNLNKYFRQYDADQLQSIYHLIINILPVSAMMEKYAVWNPDVTSDNFRIESTGKVIRTVKFKPDENILAVGYSDGYVDFWDISARKKISEIKAHNSEVTNIRFNKKLSQMATCRKRQVIQALGYD